MSASSSSSNLLEGLNPVQKQAVIATDGPTLILAGAGSGKTKVLTHRVAYLIAEKSVSPENILAITFTNKAANEMTERIINLLHNEQRRFQRASPSAGTTNSKPTMGTFHSLCARILRKDGKPIGLSPAFSIYDENDALDAVKEAMKNLNLATQKLSPAAIRSTISSAKNEMMSAFEYPQYARGYFQETVAKVFLEYQQILEKNQAADFDDLLLLTVKLCQNYPEILAKYQMQYRYILIDEYQDTNPAQYLLSKLLANRYKNICVVGDASQSIYSFRSADFRNIVNFQKDYPNAQVFNLEQNYRSTQNILDAAYAVISKNHSHPILKLWTQNSSGNKIQVIQVRNETEEAILIINTIKNLLSTNSELITLNSFAVLYRTNAQSRVLEEVFLKQGIPYVLVGGIRFYERKEVKDILAYLRLLTHPKDTVSLNRIEKIGKGRAAKFLSLAEELKLKLAELSTQQIMDLVLDKTDYLSYINDGTEVGKARIDNVKELRSVANEFPNLVEFLENLALVQSEYSADEKQKGSSKDRVTLTTLHQAKGLEWPVVFMVGMEEGLFPHSRCLLDQSEMEEERRLCYVGITRAKQQLFLTYARQRLYFGSRSNNFVSRFIADLPEELIESNVNYQDLDQNDIYDFKQKDIDDWLND